MRAEPSVASRARAYFADEPRRRAEGEDAGDVGSMQFESNDLCCSARFFFLFNTREVRFPSFVRVDS